MKQMTTLELIALSMDKTLTERELELIDQLIVMMAEVDDLMDEMEALRARKGVTLGNP